MTYTPTTQRVKRTRDRVVVDGVDVTGIRNKGAVDLQYELTEPYEFGPGSVTFPDISFLDEGQFGQPGELAWVREGAFVRVDRVDVDTNAVVERGVYRGRVITQRPTNKGLTLEFVGEASGPLSLRYKPQPLVRKIRDTGWHVSRAFHASGLDFRPHFGPTTGVEIDNGSGGMYQLGWVDQCLEQSFDGGDPWTVMLTPNRRAYEMRRKDMTTVHATVWADAFGVEIDVVDDMTEKPNAMYGAGIAPDGGMWVNGVWPDLGDEDAPSFPGLLTAGMDNNDVFVLKRELNANGILHWRDLGGGYNAGTTEAVQTVQENAGLPTTGDVDAATWRAVWGDALANQRVETGHIRPLVVRPKVEPYLYSSNGSIVGRNPDYDPDKLRIDRQIDFGAGVSKNVARRWSRKELTRANNGPNYVGTITLDADVWEGDHAHNTAGTVLEKEAVKPGWNIKVKKKGRDILFHIASARRSGNQVVLTVDTKGRDYLNIGEMIARDAEARRDIARNGRRRHQQSRQTHDAMTGWYAEDGAGLIRRKVACPGNQWTTFWVIGGQGGEVMRTTLETETPAAYVLTVSGVKHAAEALARRAPDPFALDADGEPVWNDPDIQEWLQDHLFAYIIGDADQPGGYWPKKHTNRNGVVTSHPVTGKHKDFMTWPYVTGNAPILWVSIFPDRDTVIQPQELFRASRTLGG